MNRRIFISLGSLVLSACCMAVAMIPAASVISSAIDNHANLVAKQLQRLHEKTGNLPGAPAGSHAEITPLTEDQFNRLQDALRRHDNAEVDKIQNEIDRLQDAALGSPRKDEVNAP